MLEVAVKRKRTDLTGSVKPLGCLRCGKIYYTRFVPDPFGRVELLPKKKKNVSAGYAIWKLFCFRGAPHHLRHPTYDKYNA